MSNTHKETKQTLATYAAKQIEDVWEKTAEENI
jgi:hypothetical protein